MRKGKVNCFYSGKLISAVPTLQGIHVHYLPEKPTDPTIIDRMAVKKLSTVKNPKNSFRNKEIDR